jgi:DNA-binding transcriptional ArsR family regulator
VNPVSDPNVPKSIFQILQDPTRFKIFLFLLIQDELTLLNLAQRINKSKTTIFHHMKNEFNILAKEPELIKWVEKEEGRRLKTKYFSLNIEAKYWGDEIDSYINSKDFLENLIKFTEEIDVDLLHNQVKTFTITKETQHIYEEFERKMLEMSERFDFIIPKQQPKSQVISIHTHVSVPIEEILEKLRKFYR